LGREKKFSVIIMMYHHHLYLYVFAWAIVLLGLLLAVFMLAPPPPTSCSERFMGGATEEGFTVLDDEVAGNTVEAKAMLDALDVDANEGRLKRLRRETEEMRERILVGDAPSQDVGVAMLEGWRKALASVRRATTDHALALQKRSGGSLMAMGQDLLMAREQGLDLCNNGTCITLVPKSQFYAVPSPSPSPSPSPFQAAAADPSSFSLLQASPGETTTLLVGKQQGVGQDSPLLQGPAPNAEDVIIVSGRAIRRSYS
jgi:hypothetical protein